MAGLGIDDQVDQQITLPEKFGLGGDQEWKISSANGSIRQLTTTTISSRVLNLNGSMLTLNGVNAANSFQFDNLISGTGGLTTTGAGTTTLTFAANTYSGGTFLNGGVLSVSSDGNLGGAAGALSFDGGVLRVTGTTYASTARTINWGASGGGFDIADPAGNFTLGQILSGGGPLAKLGAGTLTLTGANTYTGATTITSGKLALTGSGSLVASDGVQVDGTFDIAGTTAGASIKTLSGAGVVQVGAKDLTLTAAANTFDGLVQGAGGGLTLAGGTEVLTAANTYTGATTINGGTLRINGDQTAATGLTSVNSGGTLGGTGTVGGDVAVAGGGILAPGNSPGTLTINGALTLGAGSILSYEFGAADVVGGPLNDLTKVGGNLTLDGTINVAVTAGGSYDVGLYRVISYTGALTNNILNLGTGPLADTTVQTSIANQVNLVNTAGLTLNFWDTGAAGDSVVSGGTGVWQRAGVLNNWTTQTGAVNAAYANPSFAIFAAAPGVVTVDNSFGDVSASGMQFAVDGYRVQGAPLALVGATTIRVGDGTADGSNYTATIVSKLTGAGGLTKSDRGTLILTGANDYAGVTTVASGRLEINGDQTAATAATTVQSSGTLAGTGTVGGNVAVAAGGAIAPGGGSGPGTLTIAGDLSLSSGSILNYRLGQAGTAGGALNDRLVVNGALTLDGTLNVAASAGGTFGPGVYRLIDYTGGLTGPGLTLGALPGAGSNTIQTSIANQINLINAASPPGGGGGGGAGPPVTHPPQPLNFWDGDAGAAADGVITGGDGVWRGGAASNWARADGAANGAFASGIFAIFAATAGTVTVDDSQGPVVVGGMQFASDGYRVQGDPIILAAGDAVVRVGDGAAAGAAYRATIASNLTGAGRLDKTDLGTLILTGVNSYAGGTTISSGTLAVDGVLGGSTEVTSAGRLIGNGQTGSTTNRGLIAPGRAGLGALTIAGDYAGAGGGLEIETILGGDSSPTDRLVVTGATSGLTPVKVVNLGGLGARTDEGIRIVQVDGASTGQFALANGAYVIGGQQALVAGAYGYTLQQGRRADGAGGDWYLRSTLPAANGSAPTQVPLYQPGVPVYEGYARTLLALTETSTLRQRVGARQWNADDSERTGVWGRVEGKTSHLEPEISTGLAHDDIDSWTAQFGIDRVLSGSADGARLVGGLTGHLGGATTKLASPYGGGDIDTKAYGVGATLTWYGRSGAYVDGQAQASWFDSDLSSGLVGREADGENGRGYAVSVEAGKAFAIGTRLSLTPQGQLSYASTDFDGFTDRFGAEVASDKGESLQGRLGLALDHSRSWRDASGQARQAKVYGLINLSHEFLDGTRVLVSGTPIDSRQGRTWGGLGAGGAYNWANGRFSVYGEVAADTDLKRFGDSYAVSGSAGFRMRF